MPWCGRCGVATAPCPVPARSPMAATVRSIFTAARVEGQAAPFDTAHVRVFYPASPRGDESERMTGMVAGDLTGAPYPLVLFLPGINVGPDSYRWLFVELVNRGYAVATYQLIGETFGGHAGLTPVINLEELKPATYGRGRTPAPAIPAVLAALREVGSRFPLEGMLDLDRVVLGGHSAGGSLALYAAAPGLHPEIAACFTYAAHAMTSTALGWEVGKVLPIGVRVPVLLLGGGRDGVIAASAVRYGEQDGDRVDPIDRTFDVALEGGRGDQWQVVIGGANHFALAHPVDETSARSFLDQKSEGDQDAVRAMIVAAISLFCDAHVRADAAALDNLATWADAPPPPVASVRRK